MRGVRALKCGTWYLHQPHAQRRQRCVGQRYTCLHRVQMDHTCQLHCDKVAPETLLLAWRTTAGALLST